ncbi:MAG: TlyA family RNA methyltransferase [Defluviitaleaceae bacterium]|nr:TlyA family RNA methyltransferase [Defluviitaleaceae bacterium]
MGSKGNSENKVRLDILVSELGYSRGFSKELIQDGNIKVNGIVITSPGSSFVRNEIIIKCTAPERLYVGRGGYKLEKALDHFEINVNNLICADIGASTGGFTDCLLENGAKKVYAIDNGEGQLAKKLLDDNRVVNIESMNAKELKEDTLPETMDFICIDVSFISVTKIIYAAKSILKPGGEIICLIKPQFESGKGAINKRGVVKSPKVREDVLKVTKTAFVNSGLNFKGYIRSPIDGVGGNVEYLGYFSKVNI